jgi:multisubunit Na+/H+ antiporter MnhC subunit
MLWSIYELARFRKLDAVSLLVLGSIVLSLLALLMGGSPRLLMVRENLFSIPIGMAFLISAVTPRPAIYYLAAATFQRQSAENRARFEAVWQLPHVLRGLRVMSIVWGVGLVAQGLVLGWMAWTWPIERYLILSPIIGYGMIAVLLIWTFRYRLALQSRRKREQVLL